MSSSTSSSSGEWRVIVAVIACLVAVEVGVRAGREQLSLDLAHIGSLDRTAARLSDGRPPRVLFLGNSLTRRGIDAELAREAFGESVGFAYPDDTRISEWEYLFRRYVVRPGRRLDLVVIGFATNHLADDPPAEPRRLARYYTDWSDAPDVFGRDATDLDARVEFLLARHWVAFGEAERVRQRVLAALVPSYRESAQRMNRETGGDDRALATAPAAREYRRLARLVQDIRSCGAEAVVVAMPVPGGYELQDGLVAAVERSGATFIDARDVGHFRDDDFPDGYHMGPDAARVFTRRLLELLAERGAGSGG